MKFARLGFMLVAALSLGAAACVPSLSNDPGGGITEVVETVEGVSSTAMFAAEAAYNVPANAYVQADAAGVLTPETKAKVKPMLTKAYTALGYTRCAYAFVKSKPVPDSCPAAVLSASAFFTYRAEVVTQSKAAETLLPPASGPTGNPIDLLPPTEGETR